MPPKKSRFGVDPPIRPLKKRKFYLTPMSPPEEDQSDEEVEECGEQTAEATLPSCCMTLKCYGGVTPQQSSATVDHPKSFANAPTTSIVRDQVFWLHRQDRVVVESTPSPELLLDVKGFFKLCCMYKMTTSQLEATYLRVISNSAFARIVRRYFGVYCTNPIAVLYSFIRYGHSDWFMEIFMLPTQPNAAYYMSERTWWITYCSLLAFGDQDSWQHADIYPANIRAREYTHYMGAGACLIAIFTEKIDRAVELFYYFGYNKFTLRAVIDNPKIKHLESLFGPTTAYIDAITAKQTKQLREFGF